MSVDPKPTQGAPATKRTQSRGSLHPRLAVTFALLPLAVGLAVLGLMLAIVAPKAVRASSLGSVMAAGCSLADWLLGVFFLGVTMLPLALGFGVGYVVWRKTVRWSPGKRRLLVVTTCAVLAVHCGSPLIGAYFGDPVTTLNGAIPNTLVVAVALPLLCWLCWSPPGGRRAGVDVRCRVCGYDMRGQTECRCPECGAQHTVGELIRNDRPTPPLGCTLY